MEPLDLRLWNNFEKAGGNANSPAIVDQIVIDSRRIDSSHTLFVALHGGTYDGHHFISQASQAGAKFALVKKDWISSEPLEIQLLRVEDPLEAFQEIAAIYRNQLPLTVIGVTGSFGKTMLKDLLSAILSSSKNVVASPESFNSQIGVPLSLLTMKKHHQVGIIEAGISEAGDMDSLAKMIAPEGVIITNIDKAHLPTMKSLKSIADEKIKLALLSPKLKWSLLPQDQHLDIKHPLPHYFWNSHDHPLPIATYLSSEQSSIMAYQITFPDGNHFEGVITSGFSYFLDLINIAIKAAWLLEVSSHNICNTLKNYVPEKMRTEIWTSPTDITFINNTYCSDPQSVDQAIKFLDQTSTHARKVFVFGGMREKDQHTRSAYKRIGQSIRRSDIKQLILYNNLDFSPLIEEVQGTISITQCKDYADAIKSMQKLLLSNDHVLIKGGNKESLDHLTEAFNDSVCNNQCIVNLSAIKDNIETIRNRLPKNTRVMAIVKALAYGTDDVRMAKFLATCGIDILGVSYVEEGVVLRRAGIQQPIFVINAAPYEAAKAVKWDLEIGVSDISMIEALEKEAEIHQKMVKVHLHIDTGMKRFGCHPDDASEMAQRIIKSSFLTLEGIMTHFAAADCQQDDPFTYEQVAKFDAVIENLQEQGISPPWRHAANSSGAIRFNLPQYNMVRLGLAIYGLYPSEEVKKKIDLRLALSLISRIVGINTCYEGETISYGRSYQARRKREKIAVLPIGYYDGLHRNYSGMGHVIVRGQKAPMVGKICMDYMMVDVTDIPHASIGDNVLIFGIDEHGLHLSPEELASRGNSIAHELVTCLGPRIHRIFVTE